MSEDRGGRRPPPGAKDGDGAISRREMLEKTGKYSIAVIGIATGAGTLAGCEDTDTFACTNTCSSAGNGTCDDGGPGSAYDACQPGTDCTDCGVRNVTTRSAYGDPIYGDYSNSYTNEYYNYYSDGYSNGYYDYSNSYYDYYSNYYNYYDYYSDYYNYYSNYFSNSW